MDAEKKLIDERIRKLKEIVSLGINPYPYRYDPTHTSDEILGKYTTLKPEEKTSDKVRIAGRVMSLRSMGKIAFAHLQDERGRIQIFLREDELKNQYKLFELLDLGDLIGVEGTVFKTKTGEISVWVTKLDLLCKSIRPLPEKWHGLKDPELIYRKRYLDLIMNPESKQRFVQRSKMISMMRHFLNEKGFLEVETPTLQPVYGGAAAKPFTTMHNALGMKLYLRISDELYLKRLMVGGFEKVYEITKDFRNEGIDRQHNPEFSMMECYAAYWDYNDVMKFTEDVIAYVALKTIGTTRVKFAGHDVDLKPPFDRMTMIDAIKKYTEFGNIERLSDDELKEIMSRYFVEVEGDYSRGKAIFAIFDKLAQEKIIQPTFIIDHPIETTPLCKPHRKKDGFVERFELFIAGMEMANAYSELNDPILQRELLEDQAKQLRAGAEQAHPMDEDFLEAIEVGMPPTGGLGIGVDRLVMLLTGAESIRDVIFFPTMRLAEEK